MMSFADLVALDAELRDTPTLTLYLDGRSDNPAWRTAWRRSLRQEEARLRAQLTDAGHDERDAFSRNVEALEQHLSHRRGGLEAPGWLGVAANGVLRLEAPLAGVTPTIGAWRRGVALAPFLSAAGAGNGRAWVVIVDSRAARVFHCDQHGVRRVDAVRTVPHHLPGAGDEAHGAAHHAMRGGIGRDVAERERREARAQMLRTLASRVRTLTPLLPVFVGGTPQLLTEALAALDREGVARAIEAPVLGARARVSEIARAVHDGLAELRRAVEQELVLDLLRRSGSDGLAVTGATASGRALDEHAVQTLVLSAPFVALQPDVAEVFVRAALAQDAGVEVVSGDAARELEESGGAGVLLRFATAKRVDAEQELVGT